MSKFKSLMSPVDHLQPEAAKSYHLLYSREDEAMKSSLKVWNGQPECGPALLRPFQGRLGWHRDSSTNCPTALECNAIAVVVTLTQVPVEKGFLGWDVTTLFLWPYKPGPSTLAYRQALKSSSWSWMMAPQQQCGHSILHGLCCWEPQPCKPLSLAQELRMSRTRKMMRGIRNAGSPPGITDPHTYIEYCGQKWEGCWTEFLSFVLWMNIRSYMVSWGFFHHQYEDGSLYLPLWNSVRADIYDVIIVLAAFICFNPVYCSSSLI